MKKIVVYILITLLAIFPVFLKAEETEKTKINLSEYTTMDLKATLEEEEIVIKDKDYKNSDDKVIIYMFRGKGCGYCKSFLNFLNDNLKEYGKYFKLVSFETWYDENNAKLVSTISNFLGEEAGGVPYIIIGKQAFPGYSESYDDAIKSAIMELYDSKDRYDVFEAYNDSIKYHLSDVAQMVIWNVVLLSLASFAVIYFVNRSNRKLIEALNNKEVTVKKEVEKKPVRKTVKKKTRK